MARESSYFKKIQLSLFDFLNPKPIDKFKNKDLLGPLKYLKEAEKEMTSDSSSKLTPDNLKNSEAKQAHNAEPITHSINALTFNNLPIVIHRKPYIRHLRFSVKPNSTIHIVAPLKRPEDLILKELNEHRAWIEKCDLEFAKLRAQFPVKKFITGENYPFLGEEFKLKLEPTDFKKPFIQLDLDQLQYYYPESWDLKPLKEKESLLKKYLLKFYQDKAILHLNQRLRILSELTELYPKKISYRNQKTRWGSCSSDASLTLNWKLIAFDEGLIDYVIIHELCHIKHANHGKRFWALVERFCPDSKRLNKKLNQVQHQVDFLAPESELYLCNPSLL